MPRSPALGEVLPRRRPRIARLSSRLQLQQAITTDDGSGGENVSWQTIATVWAAIEPQSSFHDADSLRQDRPTAQLRARIWLRRGASVPQPGMRFLESAASRTWHIEAVMDADAGRHHLACLCIAEPL